MGENAINDKNSFEYLKQDYLPYIYKWGYITMGAGMLICFLPVVVLGIYYGYWPNWGQVMTGMISVLSFAGVSYVMQTISFFPLLGSAGTYMANLSGNIANMRVPCAMAAQSAAEVEPGSAAGEVCANIGIGVSTLINIIILTIGVFAGSYVLSLMPPVVNQALTYILPALSGGVLIMVGWSNMRLLPIAFAYGLLIQFVLVRVFPFLVPFANLLGIIFTIFTSMQLYKRKIWVK